MIDQNETHAMHVLDGQAAHVHYRPTSSTQNVQDVGKAARAWLDANSGDRRAPAALAPGFYPIGVNAAGSLVIGRRADKVDPA